MPGAGSPYLINHELSINAAELCAKPAKTVKQDGGGRLNLKEPGFLCESGTLPTCSTCWILALLTKLRESVIVGLLQIEHWLEHLEIYPLGKK